jgi:hypothetical protein
MYAPGIEMAIQQVTSDNLELGYSLIDKTAQDKALREADAFVTSSLAQRRKVPPPPVAHVHSHPFLLTSQRAN